MSDRAVAGRYARALFDVVAAEPDGDPMAAQRDLEGFAALLEAHPALYQVLANPAVPAARKQAAVAAVLAAASRVARPVARLLDLLAARDRIPLTLEVLAAFRARVQERLQIVHAEVTTAVTLTADRRDAVARRLGEATGKQVSIDARVDPSIIGGVVAKIGSTVYDGSVARQLERLREQLESGA
ncbi:MAG: ATP synthase F1 subunit delta [Vicinamibacterales bacterium]|jgi:F-type H+-transporting ATPase subunit delta|nr:ATP synthase F1 subunit delta [Acidobacteriota bacterium]MDP7293769.1 ATP synthase F1 subunit delta [Vicinamibacterales bacterium]MDP7470896.1 ATP synthase F1 subunit delta [Vicinamibacterales bacterium]MDP7670936.1 ATP synthase F1 subunit delta [Vicinamibacterales bacterium]HJO39680.1 ATP synthase F1 subunit delta [Vicinamibacterales bacterium]